MDDVRDGRRPSLHWPGHGAAQTSPRAGARPRRGSVERPINARLVRGTWLLVALAAPPRGFTVGRPQPLARADAAACVRRVDRRAARAGARARLSGPLARIGRAPRRRRWVAEQLRLYGFKPQTDRFQARSRAAAASQLAEHRRGRPRPTRSARSWITAHRDNNGEGRGANDNASGTAALIELARAFAPTVGRRPCRRGLAHDRLRLDGRRRVRRARSGAVRRAFALPIQMRWPSSASTQSPARAAPAPDRRRHAPFARGGARAHGGGTRARGVAAASLRARRAFRQLLDLGFPFTLGEQGVVRCPRHPGADPDHRSGRPAAGLRGRPAQRRSGSGSSAARRRASSARSTPGWSSRRERRATCTSARASSAAGRSSSCS